MQKYSGPGSRKDHFTSMISFSTSAKHCITYRVYNDFINSYIIIPVSSVSTELFKSNTFQSIAIINIEITLLVIQVNILILLIP